MVELIAALALAIGPMPPSPPSVAWGDAQHAWVGGGAGIFASADGGATWKKQTRTPGLALSAVDARHAWAIAAQGQTARTTDGVHWMYLGVQHLLSISFVDARNGFALDRDGVFLRTRDGGLTWKSPWGFRLQSLCFTDARTGWVARNGTVWTTHDGGSHWRAKLLLRAPDGNAPLPQLSCRNGDVWAMITTGAAAGSQAYAIYLSRDSGSRWRAVYGQFLVKGKPVVSNYAGPIVAFGDADAVLEGSCGPCGGNGTVTIIHGQIKATLSGVRSGPMAFGDPLRGLLVLRSGRTGLPSVWRTVDGGAHWTRVLTSKQLKP
ncbi:MAG: YCF48-related protein [Gaiellaceae bacterium]